MSDGDPRPLRWGILSTAAIGTGKVIPAMQAAALCDVAAIASRDADRAREAADALGIETAHGSYEALLDDPDIEAVYNPLPNHLHVPWTVRAAEAGKHVLCEKPIALSADEGRQLLGVRDRTGVTLAEAFMIRAHPQWLDAVRRVREGEIGALRLVACQFSYFNDDPSDIRNQADIGGGALMDIGCYAVHVARWLFDAEPDRVMALVARDPDFDTDILTSGMLDFGDGRATFTCSTQLAPYQRVQILGATGRIEIEIPFNAPPDRPCRIFVDHGSDLGGAGVREITFDPVDQYGAQGDAFVRAVRGHGSVPVSIENAIANMAVIDALFRSEATGNWETPGA